MKYQSEQLEVIHKSAKDLYELGIISAERMKEYDKGCLVPESSKKRQTLTTSPSINKPVLVAKNRA